MFNSWTCDKYFYPSNEIISFMFPWKSEANASWFLKYCRPWSEKWFKNNLIYVRHQTSRTQTMQNSQLLLLSAIMLDHDVPLMTLCLSTKRIWRHYASPWGASWDTMPLHDAILRHYASPRGASWDTMPFHEAHPKTLCLSTKRILRHYASPLHEALTITLL